MKNIVYRKYIADFETTVYEGQTSTEVWASALIPLDMPTHPDAVQIGLSIDDFMSQCFDEGKHKLIGFVNEKFDGTFILNWLNKNAFEPWTYEYVDDKGKTKERFMDKPEGEMPTRTYRCTISDMGQWYTLTIKWKNKLVKFFDVLKILPFSVEEMQKAFSTKYTKSLITYKGERHAGQPLTKEEEDYIKRDVLVPHEAMKKVYEMTDSERLTIGSMCLEEFNHMTFHDSKEHKAILPDLVEIKCPIEGFENADDYIRKSYHGGWCYVNKNKKNSKKNANVIKGGCTADVNSLYPSMMHSESGNYYPWGKPMWFTGEIPEEVLQKSRENKLYYFVRIRTRFKLKKDKLPCIQIKNNIMYHGFAREWLETSDIDGKSVYKDIDGNIVKARPELVLTQTDYELIKDHYDLYETEILDGCYFRTTIGLFDTYIDKWAEIKKNSKGAMRTWAKLFLNNLYGKLASSTNSSYKLPFFEDGILRYHMVEAHDKQAGFIAIGSAITSYARNFTIRHAQTNYKHFCYADTDSIHCDCAPRYLKDIVVHPTNFNAWKIETEWDEAVFVRAKSYVEHVVKEDGEKVEPYFLLKCAGLGKKGKKNIIKMMDPEKALKELEEEKDKITEEEYQEELKTIKKYLKKPMKIEEFREGLIVEGNLKAHQIEGGTVLIDNTFVLR